MSWPLKPSDVPLVYQMLSYLGQGATSHRNLRQDEPSLSRPLGDAEQIGARLEIRT